MRDLFIVKPKLREKGRYTIGDVYKYSNHKGGRTMFFRYKIEDNYIYNENMTGEKPEKFLKKRFLVKYVENEEHISDILLEYLIPDSIKSAPPNGWKELPNWAENNKK